MLLDIRPDHLRMVRNILQKHVPHYEVWAFGSRTKWTAKDYSDLDLCVVSDKPLSFSILGAMAEDFSDSDLPWKVDVVDWATTSESFRKIIKRDKVVVQEAGRSVGAAGEWETRKLRECCDFNPSSIKPDWPHRSLHYIDISSVGEGFQTEPPKLFLRSEAPSRAQRLVAPGDCLLSTVRPNRRSMLWLGSVADDVVASTGFVVLRAKPRVIFPHYLYYTIFNQAFTDYLVTREKGAAYPAVSTADIGDAEIALPPLTEQKAIAHIPGTLDDKIELNRRMNATLEAMARALFRSWFVDFDPVRAKLDGRKPPGLDAATAALFPAHFQDSSLGHIPEGWEVRSLDQIAHFLNGLALQKYPPGDGATLPVIKIAQLRKGDSEGADRCNTELAPQYIIEDGDVLFSWSGSLEVELWCGGQGALNQHLFKVTSPEFPKWFYYLWTLYHLDEFRLIASGKATTMGHIQRGHLTAAKVLVPPPALLKSMTHIMAQLIDQIIANRAQSRTLATLRDALLPKLLSGELSVKQSAMAVGTA